MAVLEDWGFHRQLEYFLVNSVQFTSETAHQMDFYKCYYWVVLEGISNTGKALFCFDLKHFQDNGLHSFQLLVQVKLLIQGKNSHTQQKIIPKEAENRLHFNFSTKPRPPPPTPGTLLPPPPLSPSPASLPPPWPHSPPPFTLLLFPPQPLLPMAFDATKH